MESHRKIGRRAACVSLLGLGGLVVAGGVSGAQLLVFDVRDRAVSRQVQSLDIPSSDLTQVSILVTGPYVVLANGRRLCAHNQGLRWFGLKVHARNVDMAADLEMHSFRQGYVGVCRIEADQANICGLFRRGPGWNLSNSWRELLRGPPDSSLRRSLRNAVLEESSFCSVAGLSMATLRAADAGGCRIGDAITMIPPVTGNGMSMALESSCIAAASLTAYSRGEKSWDQARREIASACDRRFARRLAWARWLQQMMFSHFLRGAAGRLALKSGLLWKILFSNTR